MKRRNVLDTTHKDVIYIKSKKKIFKLWTTQVIVGDRE